MSNSVSDEHGLDLAALFSGYPSYPAPDPLPFSFERLVLTAVSICINHLVSFILNMDSNNDYGAPTSIDSGPKDSVDTNPLQGLFHDNGPASNLDHFDTSPAPVADDIYSYYLQPDSGATVEELLSKWDAADAYLQSRSQAQTQPQLQHPLPSTVVVDATVQQSVAGSLDTSQLMSEYAPALTLPNPDPLGQNPCFSTEAA